MCAWVAQSVKCPASAQVMISRFMSWSPASGCVLTARSPEPASDSVSPFLSLPLPCSCSVFLCLKNKYKSKKKKMLREAWVAQLVKQRTDFGSGRDLVVCEFEPHVGLSAVSTEPTLDPLSPSLSAPPPLVLSLSLSLSLALALFLSLPPSLRMNK